MKERPCEVCGQQRPVWNKRVCSRTCLKVLQAAVGKRFYESAEKPEVTHWKPKKRHKSSISDRQQAKLNMDIDRKHNLEFTARVIKPTDADFEEICKAITPIQYIRKTERIVGIFSEVDTYYLGRRHENSNELYGGEK